MLYNNPPAYRTVIDKDVSRIQASAAREIDEEHALIFASHLLFLNDPTLLANIDRIPAAKIDATAR